MLILLIFIGRVMVPLHLVVVEEVVRFKKKKMKEQTLLQSFHSA